MSTTTSRDLTHNLLLPTLLFAALGGMTWAVRGCSGYGAMAGCIFAGLMWGVTWWFIAREPGPVQPRRYASGWIILAVTLGVGLSGARGWAQWSTMFEGKLQTNTAAGEWVPISPIYGFIWLFIAGMPWAGIGACFLAWCGATRPTRLWHWALRLALGFGTSWLLVLVFNHFPQFFMPLYREIEDKYRDLPNNNNLRRLMNDNRLALQHLGFYLGFLLYEVLRRDWKNVTLILTVGIVNGLGWSLLQNWTWAENLFPFSFNWWRCWESSGGISIGIAYGLAYYLVNRPETASEPPDQHTPLTASHLSLEWLLTWLLLLAAAALPLLAAFGVYGIPLIALVAAAGIAYYFANRSKPTENMPQSEKTNDKDLNLERWAIYATVAGALCINIKNGLKGWANIYIGNEDYWSQFFWNIFGPLALLLILLASLQLLFRPLPKNFPGNPIPRAYALVWLTLIIQNVLAQLVTGPRNNSSENLFSAYYLFLFAITALILHHYHRRKHTNE